MASISGLTDASFQLPGDVPGFDGSLFECCDAQPPAPVDTVTGATVGAGTDISSSSPWYASILDELIKSGTVLGQVALAPEPVHPASAPRQQAPTAPLKTTKTGTIFVVLIVAGIIAAIVFIVRRK